MALTQEQLQLLNEKYGKPQATAVSGGTPVTPENIALEMARIKNIKAGIPAGKGDEGFFKDLAGDIKSMFSNLGNTYQTTQNKIGAIGQANVSGEQGYLRSLGQTFGTVAGGISQGFGDVFIGAIKAALPQAREEQIKQKAAELIPIAMKLDEALGSPIGKTMESYESLDEKSKRDVDALMGITQLAADLAGSWTLKKAGQIGLAKGADVAGSVVRGTGKAVGEVIDTGIDTLPSVDSLKGVIQTGKELAERIPRATQKAGEYIQDSAQRAERIRNATPIVQKAIKSNLDERIINTVTKADNPTIKAYKKVIDIADETPKTIGMKKQPTIVGGELAAKQFDIVNKQKKKIGQELGDNIKQLSKTDKLPMSDSYKKIDDILKSQGVEFYYDTKGIKLDFSKTNFTPSEKTRIQELYNLATEGGGNLTPSQIHKKDQLFSKLQRESRMENLSDIMVETPEGVRSMFGIFRDIFSSKLDDVSPEIKRLNKEYRNLTLLVDDIEDSIFRTPNFNVIKNADPAEFAKVNLRRIFGEAQSSPVFEAVADQMDTLARKLGYTDASPKTIAEFAQELRKLYPESIPKTGFTGGIKSGIGDILENVSRFGTPDLIDQRKALKELIESLDTPIKKTNPVVGQTANPLTKYKLGIDEDRNYNEALKNYKDGFYPNPEADFYDKPGHLEYGNPLPDKTYKWLDSYTRGTVKNAPSSIIQDDLTWFVPKEPVILYRGIPATGDSVSKVGFRSWTYDKKVAEEFAGKGGNVIMQVIEPKDILFDSTKAPTAIWSDLMNPEEMEVIVKNIKTKSQLTDIWNKANKAK